MLVLQESPHLDPAANSLTRRGTVATIGNFDGAHLGHEALISRSVQRARTLGLPAVALTFSPHPAQVLGNGYQALGSLTQRLNRLCELGVDLTYILPFTHEFAATPAESFCQEVLRDKLQTQELFLGYDFKIGHDRAGHSKIAAIGQNLGFAVHQLAPVLHHGQPISSTRIRQALADGMYDHVCQMLGRPYAVQGQVIHGKGRGKPLLGVPTANLDPECLALPKPAIYATTARVITPIVPIRPARQPGLNSDLLELPPDNAPALPALTSFGRNPTFGRDLLTLETHILDFSDDIYGETLEVTFLRELRQERKFDSLDALKAQLAADIALRRAL